MREDAGRFDGVTAEDQAMKLASRRVRKLMAEFEDVLPILILEKLSLMMEDKLSKDEFVKVVGEIMECFRREERENVIVALSKRFLVWLEKEGKRC